MSVSKDGRTLTVKVDLTQDLGPSKTGKTRIVASTGGNKPVPGSDAFVGLNVYRYPTGDDRRSGTV
jgi:hypothetical protein